MKDQLKGAAKSNTIYFSVALALLSPALEHLPALRTLLAENYGLALFLLSVAVGGLRAITTTSLKDKGSAGV